MMSRTRDFTDYHLRESISRERLWSALSAVLRIPIGQIRDLETCDGEAAVLVEFVRQAKGFRTHLCLYVDSQRIPKHVSPDLLDVATRLSRETEQDVAIHIPETWHGLTVSSGEIFRVYELPKDDDEAMIIDEDRIHWTRLSRQGDEMERSPEI